MFQHTAARRRLASRMNKHKKVWQFQHTAARRRLASSSDSLFLSCRCFNTQPPEGGWAITQGDDMTEAVVSTHSRPKAAG